MVQHRFRYRPCGTPPEAHGCLMASRMVRLKHRGNAKIKMKNKETGAGWRIGLQPSGGRLNAGTQRLSCRLAVSSQQAHFVHVLAKSARWANSGEIKFCWWGLVLAYPQEAVAGSGAQSASANRGFLERTLIQLSNQV